MMEKETILYRHCPATLVPSAINIREYEIAKIKCI